jgi:hypothetical protein
MHLIKWTIELYETEKKEKLLFRNEYKSVSEITKYWKISKYLFYDMERKLKNNELNKNSTKKKSIKKYKKFIIKKQVYKNKNELIKTIILNI